MTYFFITFKILLPIVSVLATHFIFKREKNVKFLITIFIFFVCVLQFSSISANSMVKQYENISLTATQTHNEKSSNSHILLTGYSVDNTHYSLSQPISGKWVSYESVPNNNIYHYGWFPGDQRQDNTITETVTFSILAGKNRNLIFNTYPWSGKVEININNQKSIVDLYSETENVLQSIKIPNTSKEILYQHSFTTLPYFLIIYSIFTILFFVVCYFIRKEDNIAKIKQYKFLFSQLVKRDFILKYKRTVLGIMWSVLSPLLNLIIMWLVFAKLLGSNISHYAAYLFMGQIIFGFFAEATNQSMTSLLDNASIFTKVNVPKYLFLFSNNISSLINFSINLVILFIFILIDGVPITANYIMLVFPFVSLFIFNLGVGLILSALYVFFRDMKYLWGVACQLIMWLSAIFYSIDTFPTFAKNLFLVNPLYLFIRYSRKIILDNTIPSIWFHMLILVYSIGSLIVGAILYKKYNHKFLYYV